MSSSRTSSVIPKETGNELDKEDESSSHEDLSSPEGSRVPRPPTPPKKRATPPPDEPPIPAPATPTPGDRAREPDSASARSSEKRVRFARENQTIEYIPEEQEPASKGKIQLVLHNKPTKSEGPKLGGRTIHSAAAAPWAKVFDSKGRIILPSGGSSQQASSSSTPLSPARMLSALDGEDPDIGTIQPRLPGRSRYQSRPSRPKGVAGPGIQTPAAF
jgi:hypothetical protein